MSLILTTDAAGFLCTLDVDIVLGGFLSFAPLLSIVGVAAVRGLVTPPVALPSDFCVARVGAVGG